MDDFKKKLHMLASEITKREGKKSSVNRGDVLEILRIIAELECEENLKVLSGLDHKFSPMSVLYQYANKLSSDQIKTLLK